MFGKKESRRAGHASDSNESTRIIAHAWTVCENCGEMMYVPDHIGRKYRCQFCGTKGTNYRTNNINAALAKSKEVKEQNQ